MPNKKSLFLPFKKATMTNMVLVISALGIHQQSFANLTFKPSDITGTEGDTVSLVLNLDIRGINQGIRDRCIVSGDIIASVNNEISSNNDFTINVGNFFVSGGFDEGGTDSQPIIINLIADGIVEENETFELAVTNMSQDCDELILTERDPEGPDIYRSIDLGNPTATLTILDDGNSDGSEIPDTNININSIQLNTKTKQVLTSTSNLSIAGTRVHTQNLSKQMRRLRNGLRGNDLSNLNVNIDGTNIGGNDLKQLFGAGAGDETLNAQWGTFLGGSIQIGEDETENADLDFKVHSLFWGADYQLNNNIIIGGAIGYTDSLNEIDASKTELNGYSIAAFSSYYFDEKSYIDGIISYGRGDYDIQREFSESDGMAQADTNSNELSIALNAGHYFRFDQQFIQVFGALNYITVDIDSYREAYRSGSHSGSLLIVDDQTQKSLTSNIGVEYGHTVNTHIAVITPQISLDWERQYQDKTESISGRIVGSNNVFNVEDNIQDQNYFNLGLSVSGVFAGGISAYTSYEMDLERDNFDVYDLSLGVRWEL